MEAAILKRLRVHKACRSEHVDSRNLCIVYAGGDEDVGRFTYGDIYMNYFPLFFHIFIVSFFCGVHLLLRWFLLVSPGFAALVQSKDTKNPQQKEPTSKKTCMS